MHRLCAPDSDCHRQYTSYRIQCKVFYCIGKFHAIKNSRPYIRTRARDTTLIHRRIAASGLWKSAISDKHCCAASFADACFVKSWLMLYNGSGRRVLGALKAVFKAFLIRTSHLPVTFCGQFKASTWSSHCIKLCEIDYSLSYMSVKSKHFFMTQEISSKSYIIKNSF